MLKYFMGVGSFDTDYHRRQYEELELGATVPTPQDTRVCLLATGASLSPTSTKAEIIAAELTVAVGNYSRQILGRLITSVDTTANTLTIPGHGRNANEPVYLITAGSLPIATPSISLGTQCFVLNPTANTIQLSATPGGAAIDLSTAGSLVYLRMGGVYDAAQYRWEMPVDEVTFTASGSNMVYQGVFILRNSAASSSIAVASIASNIITTATHSLATGDDVMLTVDSGGTQPGGTSGTTIYFARAVSSTTLSLHPTAADAIANTNTVTISSAGSLARIRYAKGYIQAMEYGAVVQTIPAGQPQPIRISRNFANIGTGVGVP